MMTFPQEKKSFTRFRNAEIRLLGRASLPEKFDVYPINGVLVVEPLDMKIYKESCKKLMWDSKVEDFVLA